MLGPVSDFCVSDVETWVLIPKGGHFLNLYLLFCMGIILCLSCYGKKTD
jgi:hypothetical protein